MRTLARRIGWAAALVGLLTMATPAQPAGATGVVVDLGRVNTAYETVFGQKISRDCGYSRAVANPSQPYLFLFCDTSINSPGNITSTRGTAARATSYTAGAIPSLGDHPSPGTPVLPIPPGTGCATPLLWAQGIGPSIGTITHIPFLVQCKEGNEWRRIGWAIADYHADTGVIDNANFVFKRYSGYAYLGRELQLGSMVQSGAYYYFVSKVTPGRPTCLVTAATCPGEPSRAPTIARVLKTDLLVPRSYEWWSTTGWLGVDDRFDASPLPQYPAGFFGYPDLEIERIAALPNRPIVAVSHYAFDNKADIRYTATDFSSPGSWTLRQAGLVLPKCTAPSPLPPGYNSGFGCYAVIPHAQLSTSTKLFLTYYSSFDKVYSNSDADGHVRAITMEW